MSDESRPLPATGPAWGRSRWDCVPSRRRGRVDGGRGPRLEPRAERRRALGTTGSSASSGGGLEHPRRFASSSGLADDPPYAVLEWVGTTTLAAAVGSAGPKPRDEAIELVRALAGAWQRPIAWDWPTAGSVPVRCLLVDGAQPKLDFTGARCRFPGRVGWHPALDAACRDPGKTAAAWPLTELADLYSLGVLLVWLLTGRTDRLDQRPARCGPRAGSTLGAWSADCSPTIRPSARRRTRSRSGLPVCWPSLDATGIWVKPRRPWRILRRSPVPGWWQRSTLARLDALHEPRTRPRARAGPRLGRYRLLDKLGEGGQGVVYRAEDPAEGSVVAIKVLRTDRADNPRSSGGSARRPGSWPRPTTPTSSTCWNTTRTTASRTWSWNSWPARASSRLLAERTRLDEPEALAIMAGVARGLMAGPRARDRPPRHQAQQHPPSGPHRPAAETSPSSVVQRSSSMPSSVAARTRGREHLATTVDAPIAEPAAPRVKISDFGLARHVVDTESLALTAAGRPAGNAPLHGARAMDRARHRSANRRLCDGRHAVSPPGRPASVRGARRATTCAAQHCNEPPPPLATLNPGVSDGVARVVERALAKQPEDRYIDAGAMLRDLEALLHGKPTDMAIHPRLPDCDPHRVLQFEFRWELESSPRQLWPLVTNTDRLDRAIGFPAGEVHDPLRAGPRRADLRRGPQGRDGRGRRGASVRMGRAAADGGAARV